LERSDNVAESGHAFATLKRGYTRADRSRGGYAAGFLFGGCERQEPVGLANKYHNFGQNFHGDG
jgi:hypothetical protein